MLVLQQSSKSKDGKRDAPRNQEEASEWFAVVALLNRNPFVSRRTPNPAGSLFINQIVPNLFFCSRPHKYFKEYKHKIMKMSKHIPPFHSRNRPEIPLPIKQSAIDQM